ncbi:MAG: GNAT family N-acetyltransferase [Anaerovoracaceae bacterium]
MKNNNYKSAKANGFYSFERERQRAIFAEKQDVLLCSLREEDRKDYIRLKKENAITPRAYEMKGFEDLLWEDMKNEKAFYTTIRRKSDDRYMGYCGIKNTQKEEWELGIEMLKEFQNYGYASQSLRLFMETVAKITGIFSFKALVAGENIASQRMCEKLGGVPSGIAEYLLHDQKYMEEYERENAGKVTEQIKEAAYKFGVAPEKLLTHVLVYRFKANLFR